MLRLPSIAVLAGLGLAVSACDGKSPTEVGRPPAAAGAVVISDPAGALASVAPTIRALLESTLVEAGRQIPVGGVTFFVTPDARRAIPGWGMGGFTPTGTMIDIAVDPAFPGLAQLLPERLPPLAAHELHHAARWRGPGYGTTLLEAMISEGLADHFAMELLGAPLAPWSDALPAGETARYLALAGPELDGPYNHDRWFFGIDPAIPRWTGYTLGFRLVEDYTARHPATAAELVHTPASLFRPE